MPTDPFSPRDDSFDAEAAYQASLKATLRHVRIRRRLRKTGRAAAAAAVVMLPAWLLLRPAQPAAVTPGTEGGRIVRTRPAAAGQIIHSRPADGVIIRTEEGPGRVIRTAAFSSAALRISTPREARVPRLADEEFRQFLAAHGVYCIEVDQGLPQISSLRPSPRVP